MVLPRTMLLKAGITPLHNRSMDKTLSRLASLVFSHLGEDFEQLDTKIKSHKQFSNIYEHCLQYAIQDAALSEFERPFTPALVYRPNSGGNPSNRFYIFQWPDNLLGFLPRNEANAQDGNPVFLQDLPDGTNFRYGPLYDDTTNRKLIYSSMESPTLNGLFYHKNLNTWTAQSLELGARYIAFYMAANVLKNARASVRLERMYRAEVDRSKVYDVSNTDGINQGQRSGFTDPIDQGIGYPNDYKNSL